MNFSVKHSLPGRIRISYNKHEVTAKQAALAQSLLAEQDGMTDVSVNYTTGTFLVYYDTSKFTEKMVESYFMALSDKYLDDQELLDAVPEPEPQENLLYTLAVMTASHYLKQLLPAPVRILLRVYNLAPRILKGLGSVARGNPFRSEVLDAAAITMAVATGDARTAANINFLLDIGDTIEEFTKKKSYSDLAGRLISENDSVQLVDGNIERKIPLYMLKVDDTAVVRTGGLVPADGTVVRGEGLVNQATITGEPLAVEKRGGDTVYAGTVVQEGEIYIRVRAVGSQTKVQNILDMIDSSQQLKVSSQIRSERLADQLVRYNFLLSAAVFLFTGSLTKVMATLMVDYSCAMKLAAPIAVLSAMKEAAGYGIAVKGGKFLEDASRADTVVLDKTGTLTEAAPKLSGITAFGGHTGDEILALAACLEEHFAHPVASALVQAARERGLQHPEEHAKVEYVVAHGIVTTLKGRRLLIGSRHFVFDDEKVARPAELDGIMKNALERGESLLYLAEDDRLIGIFAVTDPVRPDAAAIIRSLHRSGIVNCTMITGDDEGAAKTAAAATGVDHYISHALPEDKVAYITEQKAAGHKVIMIGDGINDAPALAAADTGIAMGDCAAITGETADIVLSAEDGLEGLYRTRLMGRRLMEKIDMNNRRIVAVNTALMALGLFGLITPSAAALLHNASTVAFSVRAAQPLLVRKES